MVFDLWEQQFPHDEEVLCPLVYPQLKTDGILFVGLNPSFTTGWLNQLQTVAPRGVDVKTYFAWGRRKEFDYSMAQTLERYSRDNYKRFFGKLGRLAKDIDMQWEHIDLFFYRETEQHSLKSVMDIKVNDRACTMNDFGQKQLALSKTLIEMAKARIIVVANVLASHIFVGEFKPKFNNTTGYYLTQINSSTVPTFLSSMLTGGRALDVYSFERLRWHILQAKGRTVP